MNALDGTPGQVGPYLGKYSATVAEGTPSEKNPPGSLFVDVHAFSEDAPPSGGAVASEGSVQKRSLRVVAWPCFPPGLYYVPDVGQSVWVEFLGGQLNSAVWTGVWYTPDKIPKTVAGGDSKPTDRVLRTASGHVIELIDEPEKARAIRVRDAGKNELELTSKGISIKVPKKGSVTLRVEGGPTITVESGKVAVDGASSDVVVTGSGITLGKPGPQGDVLAPQGVVLNQLVTWLTSHQHTATSMGGPTSPPITGPLLKAPGYVSETVKAGA